MPASNLLSQAPVVLAADTAALAGEAGQVTQALTIPEEIPPGVYFVTVALAGPDGPLAAVTAAGRERGQVHLAPVWVDDAGPKPPAAGETALARFGPAITLWKAGATTPSADALHVSLTWQALADIAGNHQVALRLRDAAGAEWGSLDAQLAYGFYPTHFWRPGEVVPDFYTLALPAGTPPGDYQVELNLYTAPGLTSLGTTTFPALLSKATPRGDRLAQHALTEDVQLGAVRLARRAAAGPPTPSFWGEHALARPPLWRPGNMPSPWRWSTRRASHRARRSWSARSRSWAGRAALRYRGCRRPSAPSLGRRWSCMATTRYRPKTALS